jgi:hypothetical protein
VLPVMERLFDPAERKLHDGIYIVCQGDDIKQKVVGRGMKSKSKSHYDWPSVSQSWCRAPLGLMTRNSFPLDGYCPVHVGRPL